MSGHTCSECGQFVKVYWRTIDYKMAQALIKLYRAGGWHDWAVLLDRKQQDEAKLRYWGLIEGEPRHWRITEEGRQFVLGKISLPRYAIVYDSELRELSGYTEGGKPRDPITIRTALGTKFDYDKLMSGEL